MAPPPRNSAAGGFPIALGTIGGAAVGLAIGQPTLCLLAGLALGSLVAAAIWFVDRDRSDGPTQ